MEKESAVAALAALAQGSRLDVFRLLVQAGADGMPAGQIAEHLDVPAATMFDVAPKFYPVVNSLRRLKWVWLVG